MEVQPVMILISSLLLIGLAVGSGAPSKESGAAPGKIAGWDRTDYMARHTAADLHEYLNGGAARYLAYSIVDLHVQEYKRLSDGFTATLEIYRMDSAENAFGVYSCDCGGHHPEGVGQQASYGGGLLQFWQGIYYVRVQAQDPSEDPLGPVLELGAATSAALPYWEAGAEAPPKQDQELKPSPLPTLAVTLPSDGMVKDSLCFFHSQVSLNSIYYLSEKNILRLGFETDAVSAEYYTPPHEISRVIAVCYPDSATAKEVYNSLEDQELIETTSMAADAHFFAGYKGRLLVLVLEASTELNASELGQAVLAASKCGGRISEEERK